MQEKRITVQCPTEEVEQIQLFEWAQWASGKVSRNVHRA